MSLKKGSFINRKSELRDAIIELLSKSDEELSVIEIREILINEKPLLFKSKNLVSIKTTIASSLEHLLEKGLVKSKIDKSKFFSKKTAIYYFINNN